jgi:hypothetical protein
MWSTTLRIKQQPRVSAENSYVLIPHYKQRVQLSDIKDIREPTKYREYLLEFKAKFE